MALLVGRSLGHLLFFLIASIGEPVYEDFSKWCLGSNPDWPFLQGKAEALHRALAFKTVECLVSRRLSFTSAV